MTTTRSGHSRGLAPPAMALSIGAGSLIAAPASAQLDLSWWTVDGGGGVSSGGGLTISGTIGQPDAGTMAGAGLEVRCGFWGVGAPTCYANCDGSTAPPILNVADFSCFLTRYAAADPYANCDGSTTPPVLNVQDFTCFLQKYAAGCP